MIRRRQMRDLHKEMLLLQAEQLRLAMRADLRTLLPQPVNSVSGLSMEAAVNIAGAVFPGKLGRWVRLGLVAWRLGKRAFSSKQA